MDFYKNKNVIVTGGCGFIGSHLVERLVSRGANVTVIDNLDRGFLRYLDDVRTKVKVDLTDLRCTDSIIFGPYEEKDLVFHLAFKVGGILYTGTPVNFNKIWSEGTRININVIDAVCRWKIPKLLFVSTACVYSGLYQKFNDKPLREHEVSGVLVPDDAYGWSKLVGELQVKWAYENHLIKEAVILRPFNIYGPREYCDRYYGHALPVLCRKAIEYPDKSFTVHGLGETVRCFLYISDMVDALVDAMEFVSDPSPINVGSTDAININALAEKIIAVSEKNIVVEYISVPTEGVESRIPDISLARKRFDFEPKISLDDGLRITYRWVKNELGKSFI